MVLASPVPPQITLEELEVMDRLPHYCPVCAYLDWNMEGLIEMVWDYLAMVGGEQVVWGCNACVLDGVGLLGHGGWGTGGVGL